MKFRIALALIVVLMSLLAVSPALAEEHPHCESGAVFGQHHAEMAQVGMLGADMNPGMHQGFSVCLL